MRKPGPYHNVQEGEWIDVDRRDNYDQCCDCGLVHRVEYRITEKRGKPKIESRCWRDDKATARIRKRRGLKMSD